ncbi:ABC transporter ATP-binding protein [Paraburkholderia caledonica]|uniref:ABC transporter ATP-binding protein n=1 Tax=Paraburkholderia caledonica TaxID=134536 RepID=UPI000380A754|nr:ABC transporter ATP-binding protein [Paraburkholderia caledonica]
MESKSIIDFVGVQKSYDGENLVVKDLNLSIRRGEFLTLLGASGSGKTTTLMMLAGFETPTLGGIWMNGKPIETVPAHKRGIGMVFQNYALFPHMTVEQNLAYPLRMRNVSRNETVAKVKRAVDMVRLHGMERRRPSELSGGQQQRVALARAMVFEPELILMDEPLGALDKNLREHMQYEIKQLHHELGVTVVYVTHDQAEAMTMSDRIAVFQQGVISQIGSPDELYERPANLDVASFIGESNRLTGTVVSVGSMVDTVRLTSGLSLEVPSTSPVREIDRVVEIVVRPERVSIEQGSADDQWQWLQGRVSDLTYLGDHLRVLLVTDSGDSFIAKVSGAYRALPSVGQELRFGWRTQDAHAFQRSMHQPLSSLK